MKRMKNFDRRN